ncbi:unnamed protein product, partial [Rotaria sp. Silwood1]
EIIKLIYIYLVVFDGSPFLANVTKHNNPLWSLGKLCRGENELSMPVSIIVDDCNGQEQVYILDPGNSRIKCLNIDGKFIEHLAKKIMFFISF